MTTRSLRLLNLPPAEHEAFANAHKDAPLKRQVCLLNYLTCFLIAISSSGNDSEQVVHTCHLQSNFVLAAGL